MLCEFSFTFLVLPSHVHPTFQSIQLYLGILHPILICRPICQDRIVIAKTNPINVNGYRKLYEHS